MDGAALPGGSWGHPGLGDRWWESLGLDSLWEFGKCCRAPSLPSWRGRPERWEKQKFLRISQLQAGDTWQMALSPRVTWLEHPCASLSLRAEGGSTPNFPWKTGFSPGVVLSLFPGAAPQGWGDPFFPLPFLFWQRWSQVAQLSNKCLCTAAHTACGK